MKALSFKPPWGWLVVHGFKTVENRKWPTTFRGRVYVHSSKTFDYQGFNWLCKNPRLLRGVDPDDWASLALYPPQGLIGEVDIVDCVSGSDSPWFFGPYGFVLANAQAYDKPIPYRGKLSFFDVLLPKEAI